MGIIARQTIKGSIANYLGIAIGFATTFFVLTDCLSPSEIGLTRIMVDAAVLFSSLAMLGTNSSIVRFYPYFRESDGNDHGFFGWAFLLPLVGYALFALLFLLGRQGILDLYSERSPLFSNYVFYLLPLTFFALYTSVFEACANVLMRIAVPKFVREVGIRLCNLVSYLLYGRGLVSLDLFVLLFCSSYALAALCDFLYLLSLGKISFRLDRHFLNRKLVREIFAYTLLVTAVGLTSNVQLFNSLFLGAQGGLALAGVYTIAAYISNVVGVPSRSLHSIANPVISQAMKSDDLDTTNNLVRKVSLLQLLVGALLYFFICINLHALYALIPHGAEYADGIGVVVILGLSAIVTQTCGVVASVLNFSRSFGYALPFSFLMTLAAIGLNLLLIPLLGVDGAAAATLGSTLLYYGLMMLFVHRRLGISILTWKHLVVVGIVAFLFLLNLLWSWLIAPMIPHILIDAICRTLLLAAVALPLVLRAEISTEFNDLVVRYLPFLRRLTRNDNQQSS